MSEIELYSRETISALVWPSSDFGRFAQEYLTPLIENGVGGYIANVETELCVLAIDDLVLPVSITTESYESSYVCSPYNQYITYAKEELYHLKNKPLEKVFGLILSSAGFFLRKASFNRVVAVNNWLVSTNLYPDISEDQIKRITEFLSVRFKEYAILFRSIPETPQSPFLSYFSRAGYLRVASRQIYLWNPLDGHLVQRRDFKTDAKLLSDKSFLIKTPQVEDAASLRCLYDQLYLQKYSFSNPRFTDRFFKLLIEKNIFSFLVINENEKPIGVLGYFVVGSMLTTPILGYDTSRAQIPLYRILSYLIFKAGNDLGITVHASSGAASFKRNRGCVPYTEYLAVYVRHLGLRQKIGWYVVRFLVNRIGLPIIKYYQL